MTPSPGSPRGRARWPRLVLLALLCPAVSGALGAEEPFQPLSPSDFDSTAAWPLCGRIAEDPPPGWTEAQGCPASRWGDASFGDFPLSDTFGPRVLGSSYDHHRGLDIPTPIGTPVFAVSAGVIDKSEDDTVQIEHLRPGASSCDDGGCWYSRAIHLSSREAVEGQNVVKGQLIGHSGDVGANFPHVHFEIRSAPDFDPESAWQRDCVHPLAVLPYPDQEMSLVSASLTVDAADPNAPVAVVSVTIDADELDLARVEIEVWERVGGTYRRVGQPGATPNGDGYHVEAPWLDLHQLNFEYSHKDSSAFPWESFADCPYVADHGAHYDGSLHLDAARDVEGDIGAFDGRWIEPFDMNQSSTELRWDVTFRSLVGTASADDLCVVARLFDVRGGEMIVTDDCGLLFVDGFEAGDADGWSSSTP